MTEAATARPAICWCWWAHARAPSSLPATSPGVGGNYRAPLTRAPNFPPGLRPPSRGRIFSASNSMWFGPQIEYSHDLGGTWEQSTEQPRFTDKPEYAEHDGPTVANIWHIEPGRTMEPNTLYAGVQPAALFKSTDGGATWHEVEGPGPSTPPVHNGCPVLADYAFTA